MRYEKLEKALGHFFTDIGLLELALTHPSVSRNSRVKLPDNQRLEFLGDAVLQLSLSDIIYNKFPEYKEGEMTALRSKIVSKKGLVVFSEKLKLGEYMIMSKAELAQKGQYRESTIADAFEAVLGAVFMDANYLKAKKMLVELLEGTWGEIIEDAECSNPKGKLQEILQALNGDSPVYNVISETGRDHDKVFKIEVRWCSKKLGIGTGKSKKNAESDAAKIALSNKYWMK